VITDEPGWHGRVLHEAFAARGLRAVNVSSSAAQLDLSGGRPRVNFPNLSDPLAGVFVRGIPGGTLEQVILRLNTLHAWRELGVTVVNDARAIERTVDKAMTSLLLKLAGIPTPATWACESPAQARQIAVTELTQGRRLVVKPLFGSQGEGIRLIEKLDDLDHTEGLNGVFYLQTFIDKLTDAWADTRVLVIKNKAICAMRRSNAGHWVTNRAKGAKCEALPLAQPLAGLAEAASRAVNIDYAGVDLIPLADGGYTVTEVNSIPAWQGLQSVTMIDIAAHLVDHFCERIAQDG
jgi:RimK family alpha-L-glutamate ligase